MWPQTSLLLPLLLLLLIAATAAATLAPSDPYEGLFAEERSPQAAAHRLPYDVSFGFATKRNLESIPLGSASHQVTFEDGLQFTCFIPPPPPVEKNPASPASANVPSLKYATPVKEAQELLAPLVRESFCKQKFPGGWWVYEVCFGQSVKQVHLNEKGQVEVEHVLGKQLAGLPESAEMKGSLYIEKYGGGAICDLTGKPRETSVVFSCSPGKDTLLQDLTEVATCKYQANIKTPLLCEHSRIKPMLDADARKDAELSSNLHILCLTAAPVGLHKDQSALSLGEALAQPDPDFPEADEPDSPTAGDDLKVTVIPVVLDKKMDKKEQQLAKFLDLMDEAGKAAVFMTEKERAQLEEAIKGEFVKTGVDMEKFMAEAAAFQKKRQEEQQPQQQQQQAPPQQQQQKKKKKE